MHTVESRNPICIHRIYDRALSTCASFRFEQKKILVSNTFRKNDYRLVYVKSK